jgi:CRISPR system Cascade subunit CasB
MKFDNETRKRVAYEARSWWKSLGPGKDKSGSTFPGDRAALARLRRADGDPLDALAEVFARVAVLASLLAHVREDNLNANVGRALGPTDSRTPESAAMKPLRLARLLNARGDAEIGTAFRRAVALLGDTANVGDLAWLVLTWDRDEAGDRTRTLFAFAYHDASAHAPGDTPSADAASAADTPSS